MSVLLPPTPNGMDLEFDLQGKLGAFTLSDLIQMLSFTQKSGTVTLIQGWNLRTITFADGRVTYVAAGSRLPTMTDLLLRLGKIRRDEIDSLARAGVRREDTVLARLRRDGRISDQDLQTCRDQLLEMSVYTLFLWRNCYFTFKSGEIVYEDGVEVDVDSMQLIIEGTRRVDEWIEISPVVPSVYMIFRRCRTQPPAVPALELQTVFQLIDGKRDVVEIARLAGLTQFQVARVLYDLVHGKYIEAVPPNRLKVVELFNLAVESIYLKLVLFDRARIALEFENQLNRFAIENRLKVRMAAGKILMSDQNTPITSTELVDLYRLFIGIQNNKFSKIFEPVIAQGLMEGLYLHTDVEFQQMMRMYEFIQIEGLLLRDMFNESVATAS